MRAKKLKPGGLAAFAVAIAAASVCADTITKNNGAVINGRIVTERLDAVVVETETEGIVLRQGIPRSQIRSIQRERPPVGPAYVRLPIQGVIGGDVTAAALAEGFTRARAAHANYVVLVFDSPGGDIQEMYKIVELVRGNQDLRPIAYVHQAISAAAIIAVSCPAIFMAPDGAIGAAVPWHMGPDGTPKLIEEKFESVVRARMRTAAQLGRHDELWVRGWTEPEIALAITSRDGKRRVIEAPAAPSSAPATASSDSTPSNASVSDLRIIKTKGRILTTTAGDAEAGGLSMGTIAKLDAIHGALGIPAWHSAGDQPWFAVLNKGKADRQRQETEARREDYIRHTGPAMGRLESSLTQWAAREMTARNAADKIRTQWQQDAAAVTASYQQSLDAAAGSSEYPLIEAHAAKLRDRKLKALSDRYRPQLVEYERLRDEAHLHVTQISGTMKEILDHLPGE